MSEPSARERFVEAMMNLVSYGTTSETVSVGEFDREIHQACEAFADAVCEAGGDSATCPLACDPGHEGHSKCRAALVKEVMG
jgi:hypothetical protein